MENGELLLVALLSAAVLTGILLRFHPGQGWLDTPNARSAHDSPMPTAGGVPITLTVLAISTLWYLTGQLPAEAWYMILGGGGVALLGLRDDLAGLRVRWRLLGQTGAALWAVWWLDGVPTFFLGPWEVVNGWFVYGLALFAFVWLLNLFNFMDGLDGLAASEAGFVTLLSSLLLINSGDQVTDLLSLLTLAAVLGFLVWNWPPARIFMGDAGSGFLGYMLGILALWSIAAGSISVWSWLLMMGVFAIDATYTLFRRIADGQDWYLGHDTHAYQHAARRFGSHGRVVMAILTINLFWLAPLAWLANLQPQAGLWLTMLGWFPLILLARMIGAGSQLTAGRAGTESARS